MPRPCAVEIHDRCHEVYIVEVESQLTHNSIAQVLKTISKTLREVNSLELPRADPSLPNTQCERCLPLRLRRR